MKDGHGVHNEYVPGTYRPLANKDNDYLMDRSAQKRGETFSGVKGIAIQDASLQESMGPIVDRSKERLVPPTVELHQGQAQAGSPRRWRCARTARCRRASTRPTTGSWSASIVLPKERSFLEAARDAVSVIPGVPQTSV